MGLKVVWLRFVILEISPLTSVKDEDDEAGMCLVRHHCDGNRFELSDF